jgi:hypothetical protein
MLKVVIRERLVKTEQAGKNLAVACNDLQSVEISESVIAICN